MTCLSCMPNWTTSLAKLLPCFKLPRQRTTLWSQARGIHLESIYSSPEQNSIYGWLFQRAAWKPLMIIGHKMFITRDNWLYFTIQSTIDHHFFLLRCMPHVDVIDHEMSFAWKMRRLTTYVMGHVILLRDTMRTVGGILSTPKGCHANVEDILSAVEGLSWVPPWGMTPSQYSWCPSHVLQCPHGTQKQ